MIDSTTTQTVAFGNEFFPVPAETNSDTDAFHSQAKFALRQSPPRWLHEILARLQSLAGLDENWDSYGASPIDVRSIWGTQRLVEYLAMFAGVKAPAVGGTPDGEAGLSWDGGHWSLDADVTPDGQIDYVFIDDRNATRDFEASTRDPRELLALLTDWQQSPFIPGSEKNPA